MKALKVFLMVLALIAMIAGVAVAEPLYDQGARHDRDGRIGKDTRSVRQAFVNSIVGEGPTSDAYETYLYFQDVSADTWFLFPNSPSGATLSTISGGVITVNTVGSAQIIDNTVSSADILNATIASIDIATGGVASVDILDNAVTSADILNSTIASIDILDSTIASVDILDNSVTGADILNSTIAAADLAANSVGASEAFINSTTVFVPVGATYGAQNTPDGAVFLGYQPIANSSTASFANTVDINTTTDIGYVCTTAAAAVDSTQVWKIIYMMVGQ